VIASVEKLKQYFRGSYKNLQPFKTVVNIAKKRKDDLLIERFGYQIMELQDRLKTYVETPGIELVLITSLKHQKKFEQAKDVNLKLLKHDLKPDVKARAYYELGHSYQQLGDSDKARDSFLRSSEASPDNVWGKLSRDYIDLM
jgi:tetratricopeptide (TPR) repeat protein